MNIAYELRRSRRRRTLAIRISPEGRVIVYSPQALSARQIEAFVASKEGWLEKHLRERAQALPPFTDLELDTLVDQARRELPGRVAHYAPLVGVTYGRITVRKQKTRWGSCSAKGNLNFNCLLMLAPPQVVDYVVIHELCHRKEMNHSPQFWAAVRRVCPDDMACRKWLRKNGPGLIARLP